MTIRGVFFIGLFAVCSLMAFAEPFAGVVAYVVHYHTYPEKSWWGSALSASGVRYSYTITACLALGTLLNLGRLPYGRLISRHEALYLVFLCWMLLSRQLHGQLTEEDAIDKMYKMAIFLLALTHIVVTPRRFYQFVCLLTCCALYLGYEGFTAPPGAYFKGRLNGIGGPDFTDSNAFAGHMLVLLTFVGIRFVRSDWKGKAFCVAAGVLCANTIVATRSRGAFLGAVIGVIAALILAPKGQRKRIWPLVLVGAIGSVTLMDSGFVERMGTLEGGQREKDASAQDRIASWKAGLRMAQDHPLGVGPGNFAAHMGHYLEGHHGRDTHNTYIRCLAELGVPGFALFVGLIVNAFLVVSHAIRSSEFLADGAAIEWYGFGLRISMIVYLVNVIFISAIYLETMWWLILLPAALERVVANSEEGRPGLFSYPK